MTQLKNITDTKSLPQRKRIAILGSTGSIGTQTLDIIAEYPELFEATLLTAHRNWQLLTQQALRFRPKRVLIADAQYETQLRTMLNGTGIEVLSGPQEIIEQMDAPDIDLIVAALVGYSGVPSVIRAVQRGKKIALANKETLVAAGQIIYDIMAVSSASIIPVDSEHSAIFQCLQGESYRTAGKIILTASGGPFRNKTRQQLENVTISDALAHPNWNMGAKVTIDSASMMNKGFEMIEAHWLFSCPVDKIEVTVHPQSIVHSMVQFADGSIKAQLGVPDMHLPIRYALGYPHRLSTSIQSQELKLNQYRHLTFEEPDTQRFPLLTFAYDAITAGGNMPCILNAANEVAVSAFLHGKLRFMHMPELIHEVMAKCPLISSPSYDDIMNTNNHASLLATELLPKYAE